MLLIGTGPMAKAYSDVLDSLSIPFKVIGRGPISAKRFESETGIKPYVGGLTKYLSEYQISKDQKVIIATGVEMLMSTLKELIGKGVERILIEKPAAISITELELNKKLLIPFASKILIGYNRRFYASVIEAEKLIRDDGGLLSMQFEFTEWAHKIEPLQKAPGVKENWFFANSTHVVDLAFFLGGNPLEWSAYSRPGNLTWHLKTNFAGAGITEKGVIFSYLSNWESAGRWSIELLTNKRRIYLKPLEGISIQEKGSVQVVEHNFDNSIDIKFKPGLYKQVEAFIQHDTTRFTDIAKHIDTACNVYAKIIA